MTYFQVFSIIDFVKGKEREFGQKKVDYVFYIDRVTVTFKESVWMFRGLFVLFRSPFL